MIKYTGRKCVEEFHIRYFDHSEENVIIACLEKDHSK